ncbi:ABC transporter ATP-binding protein [Pontibacter russatus]|uniref:ABC transporter ATP-binding protein n=1 Tax=Pontibacter russatus TaxID=2694929 RepID=UPI00137A5AC4|nr:ABC transporter ATP-binding protein [Pontibacter russatus]
MSARTPLLQIEDLETLFSTHYGVTKAVDKISFEIYPGETVAIVGESGSGKSVTALSLMQLIDRPGRIAGGKAAFQSEKLGQVDLFRLPEKQMRQLRGSEISMIFQEPMSSLNPVTTCGKQVAEALLLHTPLSKKAARERTILLFEKVKLPRPEAIYNAYPHEISGGQKQRVMVAMAMACGPTLLIADEPTTALDVTVQARMLQLIDELRVRENTAVLFITHDLGVVAGVADRILVMYRGKLVEQGRVLDIFTNPQHPYTKGLLACRPSLSAQPQAVLPTVADFMEEDALGNITEKKKLIYAPPLEDGMNSYIDRGTAASQRQQQENKQKPLLRVKDLKVYFPIRKGLFGRTTDYIKAVDGVSFEVQSGETIGLVGESGCGKTTLGRALLRLVEPTAGSIQFGGRDIAQLSAEELRRSRRNLQMIFQDPYASLNPMHTIGEAIMEPMQVHNLYGGSSERRGKAMELLEKVKLVPEHFQRYPHEFSGGQRQRISIARALALQPKCLICDEPVSSLDVSVQAQVLNLLNRLKQELGITYIFITHDLSVARHMADRILVMRQGRIIESGTPAQLFQNPQQEYTRALLSAIPKGEPEDIMAAQQRREAMKAGL